MRESKSKSRKTRDNSEENNSASLQMELELTAVKAKNAELIRAHTKLVQENSELKNQIYLLQADLVDIQAKYNNVESVLKNLEQNMKKCTPNLIDILNLFLQVSDSRKNSFNILNMSSSNLGFTPKTKAITHTVKPHTVNGTVLNLVPTISLTRLNTNSNQRINDVTSTSPHIDYRNSLPSTSTSDNSEENHDENLSTDLDNSEVENQSFVSRRRNTNSTHDTCLNGYLDSAEDDIEAEEQQSDESEPEEENVQRLSTIQEESLCSTSGRKRTSLGEVRIYLSRLSAEDMRVRCSQNASFSSTEPNVNDTCLNIETTVIENPESRVSKRLRADIMVFSPHTNSTRMEGDNSIFNDLSPMNNTRKTCVPELSDIQSAEVTPSTSGLANDSNGLMTNDRLAWMPTPSLSAMGDINTSNTKLEILKESNNKFETIEHSPVPSSVTPQRYTRASNKIQTRSHSRTDDESPRSSTKSEKEKKALQNLITKQRGGSSDRPLTPTIVLERLENILPQSVTTSSVNIQIVAQTDEPKENETPPKKRETRSKKKMKESKSKAPKKSLKRKNKDEEESGILHEKIREIQIRLSNYIPETSQNNTEIPENTSQRPKRAARPTSLKDASLRGKLRRMF